MQMKKKLLRVISLMLCIVMLTTVMPVGVYAQEEEDIINEASSENVEDVEIEYEIESKRTENSKTYLTEDGGYYQVSAAVPIHEEVNGEWEEISSVNSESVETAEDATNLVTQLASTNSDSDSVNTGLYDSETLTMYSYPSTTESTKVISKPSVNDEHCIYIKPNLISEKSVFIHSAILSLSVEYTDGSWGYANVYPLTKNLTGQSRFRLKYDNILYDSSDLYEDDSDDLKCDLDITSYCHYCSIGLRDNKGLAITPRDSETYMPVTSIVMSIYYKEIGDIDRGIGSEIIDFGRAGTVYINDYTCSPIILRNDFGIFNEIAEVNIQTVINPAAIDESFSDGINTRTNYYSTLQFDSNEYYWKNCEGDYIYFIYNSDETYFGTDGLNKYELSTTPSNGYDITIKKNIDNENNDINDDMTYRFKTYNSVSYLKEIEDGYSNVISIKYDDTYTNISSIIDGSGREYRYNYGTNGYLSFIDVYYTDNGTKSPVEISGNNISINYNYDSVGRLSEVVYADGYTITYDYDSNDRLTFITTYNDSDKTNELKKLSFIYDNKTADSNVVKSYSISNKGNVIESISISSPNNDILKRTFSNTLDSTNKVVLYNPAGDLIQYKSYSDQNYYLNYTNGELRELITEDDSEENLVLNGSFENSNNDWTFSGNATVADAPLALKSSTNHYSLKTEGDDSTSVSATQSISNLNGGASYVLTCTASLNGTAPISDKKWISAKVYYTSGNSKILLGRIDFDYMNLGSQQTLKTLITLPENVSDVTISLENYYMPGECYFDDISLYPATVGNVINVGDGSLTNEYTLNYNSNGTLASETKTSAKGEEIGTYYAYDSNNYVSLIENNGVKTHYNYNSSNGLLMSKGTNSDSSKNTQYVYNGIGALTQIKQIVTNIDGTTSNLNTSYTYEDDMIKTITHNGCTYEYEYNPYGKVSKIQVLDNNETDYKIEYSYADSKHLGSIEYANGTTVVYTYDGDNITDITYYNSDNTPSYKYSYEYDSNGKVIKYEDSANGTVTTYSDNGFTISKGDTIIYSNEAEDEILFGKTFSASSNVSEPNSNGILTNTEEYEFTDTIVDLDEDDNFIGTHEETSKIESKTLTDSLGRKTGSSFTVKNNFQVNNSTTYLNTELKKTTNLISTFSSTVSKANTINSNYYTNKRITRTTYYEYNDAGLITDIYRTSTNKIAGSNDNTESVKRKIYHYEYDETGQVILEVNTIDNKAIKYTYDNGGNITSKKVYTNDESNTAYTYNKETNVISFDETKAEETTMSYKNSGMKDYLVSYNGTQISYDQSGNPTNYVGKNNYNDSEINGTLIWNGRLLESFIDDTYRTVYKYDGDNRRTEKVIYLKSYSNEIPLQTTEYIWDEDLLVGYHIVHYKLDEEVSVQYDRVIRLIYDSNNEVTGLKVVSNEGPEYVEENVYTFIRDGQGNITDLYDSSEVLFCSYTYDAYGNFTPHYSGSLIDKTNEAIDEAKEWWEKLALALALGAAIQAYSAGAKISSNQEYRGYMYDMETGLYCNQNRYYSPSWGRFINADDPSTLQNNIGEVNGANLFTYCSNDPINEIDPTGCDSTSYLTNQNILSALNVIRVNMTDIGMSTNKLVGNISNELNILGFKLSANTEAEIDSYWDRVLGRVDNTVGKNSGAEYINTSIEKNQSAVTTYSINKNNRPYKIYSSANK